MSDVRVFGIRHHGPGSARSLVRALNEYSPDAVLIEGPPDAEEILPLASADGMKPPVALLIYDPESPQRAVFYPFAAFSPEWQAILLAAKKNVPVRFMDLPQSHRFALAPPEARRPTPEESDQAVTEGDDAPAADRDAPVPVSMLQLDPLAALATVAGFTDSERWWDHLVESRRGGHAEVFDAIADAMIALRESPAAAPAAEADAVPAAGATPGVSAFRDDRLETLREAWMRKTIRAAKKEGFERIAVVCGAWHVPALRDVDEKSSAAADTALLKGLAKSKTAAAWVPWSYDRLAMQSGYGAGVASPEWYHLLWSDSEHVAVEWLTRAARLMRKQDLDASPGHVIEAVRLSEALAAMRGRSLPGLDELDEAALTVMCFGEQPPMHLIRRRLVIGERLGKVPDDAPLIPLQMDLQRQQKVLRLPVRTVETDYDLDLRKPLDLDRSRLLHRLRLLGVPWGETRDVGGKTKGTFHENWRVQWDPEFVVRLVEAGRWGNTIADAATGFIRESAAEAPDLRALTSLLDDSLLADLPDAVESLIGAIRDQAAVATDVPLMMDSLTPMAAVSRYGNVRKTDVDMVLGVVDGLVQRICIGLSNACASLDDDAARAMFDRLAAVHAAIGLVDQSSLTDAWIEALRRLTDQAGLHGLVAGRASRILYDRRVFDPVETGRRLSLALSLAVQPSQAAAWVEGLLAGSGQVLIHDESLWAILDAWVATLTPEHFAEALPLLRRTFATFAGPERKQMGDRVARGTTTTASSGAAPVAADFDYEQADVVLPILARILGVELK